LSSSNITTNYYGVVLDSTSDNNIFYHNNFVNNVVQAYSTSVNVWNNGYPSSGNYWSDYSGTDGFNGPDQNVPGPDGIGDTPYSIVTNDQDYYPLMTPWPGVHDVAVTILATCKDGCTPIRTVGQNYTMDMIVFVVNQGSFAETSAVTVYANATVINQTQLTLRLGLTLLLFKWNATLPYGNYTLSAVADTVPEETDTTDNTYIDGTMLVTIPGDITTPWLYVQYLDLGRVIGNAYGKTPSSPYYDPNADINDDHKISYLDLGILLARYGQQYP
jgi:hypothetical protein